MLSFTIPTFLVAQVETAAMAVRAEMVAMAVTAEAVEITTPVGLDRRATAETAAMAVRAAMAAMVVAAQAVLPTSSSPTRTWRTLPIATISRSARQVTAEAPTAMTEGRVRFTSSPERILKPAYRSDLSGQCALIFPST